MSALFLPNKHLTLWHPLDNSAHSTKPPIGGSWSEVGTPVYAAGKFGNAFSNTAGANYFVLDEDFDSYVNINSGAIDFWVNFNNFTGTQYMFDIDIPGEVKIRCFMSSSTVTFSILDGGSVSFPTSEISTGTWYHFSCVWAAGGINGSSDTIRLYRDSSLQDSATTAMTATDDGGAQAFHIGRINAGTGYFDGLIDNFKVWNYPKINFSDRIVERISNVGSLFLQDKRVDLFNKLGNSAQVTNSTVGPAGVATGGAYVAGKHDNGFQSIAVSNYVDFPLALGQKGSYDIWFKTAFSSSDVTVRSLVDRDDTAVSVLLRWDGAGAFEASIGGLAISHSPTFSASDDLHLAVEWDSSGINGSSDKLRLYYNSVQQASSTTALSTIASTALRVGTDQSNTNFANGVLDTIKVRNYTKGNYSDKEYEYFANVGSQFINPDERLPFWQSLSSSIAIQKPKIGDVGTEAGSGHSFVAGKFSGKALYIPNWADTYKPEWNFTARNAGCVDFWFKADYNSTDIVSQFPYHFYHDYSSGGSTFTIAHWDQRSDGGGEFHGLKWFLPNSADTGTDIIWYEPSFLSGEWHHYGYIWDSNGLLNTSDTRRFYFDGVRQTRMHGVVETQALSTSIFKDKPFVAGNFRTTHSATRAMKGVMQNIRFHTYANFDAIKNLNEFPNTLKDNAELVVRS